MARTQSAETCEIAKKFVLPGARPWAGSAAAPLLAKVGNLLHKYRAHGTWTRLAGPWRKARYVIEALMAADGLVLSVETLGSHQFYVIAAAMVAFSTSSAISAVSSCFQACHMAIRVS